MKLGKCCQAVPVVLGSLPESVPALIPAIRKHHLDTVSSLYKGKLISLILDP